MMKLLIPVLLAVVVVSVAEPNCSRNGVSCPDYEVVESFDGYETRLYPEATLVSTSGRAKERKQIIRRLIMRLYRYIGGHNKENARIELMVPVRTLKSPGEDDNNYTISFFLPKQHAVNPPEPNEPSVFIERVPETYYAVRGFGNLATGEHIWDKEAKILFDSLSEDEVESSDYFWALYDPPVILRKRLNEVWVRINPKKENQTV